MTLRPKSSLHSGTAGLTIAPVSTHSMGSCATGLHEDIEAALDKFQTRSCAATAAGALAFARLLGLAVERNSGQITRVVGFLAAVYDGEAFPLDPFELRAVDVAISDDMLHCLDALRWGRADLHTLDPDGDQRMRAVIARWGLAWPDAG